MSFLDLNTLSPQELITQYVLECRGRGHCLPYDDYEVVSHWLGMVEDPDDLLIVLSDELPKFYAKHRQQSHPPPLKKIRKFIDAKLCHALMTKT